MIDFGWRNSSSIFGKDHVALADRKIVLDDKLKFDVENKKMNEYVTTVQANACRSLTLYSSVMERQKGITNKTVTLGKKYPLQDAIDQISAVEKAIEKRKKKNGVVLEDKDFNGL